MELYKETINTVEFEAPNETVNVTATYSYNGGTPTSVIPTRDPLEPAVWRATTPYLPEDGTFVITWKFKVDGTEYNKSETYNVVTPYVSARWIRRNLLEDATDEEIRAAEASARFIINAHTGQNFGKRKETVKVFGSGGNSLALPNRLLSATTINGVAYNDARYTIIADGWYLLHPNYGVPPVKADYYGLHMLSGGVIHNPYNISLRAFSDGAEYEIAGTWGWNSVPEDITEATKLLINDYACSEGIYRDKYLLSMTAADWRIQFTAGAFAKTGNVRADQLLSNYVLNRGWVVV